MGKLKPAAVVALGAGLLLAALRAQDAMPWQSGGDKTAPAVRYEYPEQVSIAAGKPAVVELHFRVRDGLHINSHVPLEKSLIRTDLVAIEPPGVKISAVDFPDGVPYAVTSMPNEKLSVYTGEVVLRAHVTAQAGEHLLQAALRYQACDSNSCYPPKKAQVAVDVIAK